MTNKENEQMENKMEQTAEPEKQTLEQADKPMEQTLEWLTVPEFAERAGCTKQAVYYRLGRDLAEYCKLVDGKKVIDSRAVKLIAGEQKQTLEQTDNQMGQTFFSFLQEEIAILRAENEELKKAIAEKDDRILEFTGRFADMAENEQKIAAMALAAEPPKLEAGQRFEQTDKQTEQTAEPEKKSIFGWLRKK